MLTSIKGLILGQRFLAVNDAVTLALAKLNRRLDLIEFTSEETTASTIMCRLFFRARVITETGNKELCRGVCSLRVNQAKDGLHSNWVTSSMELILPDEYHVYGSIICRGNVHSGIEDVFEINAPSELGPL